MIPLRNSATGNVAMISSLDDVRAIGAVYINEADLLAAKSPESTIVLDGTHTYQTATTALHASLGAGWALDQSQIPPADQMISTSAMEKWMQPTGAHDAYPKNRWVTHAGYNYYSLIDANVWEPSPQSTLWQISPLPPPLPWVQPTGAQNAYKINDEVTHTYPGRSETHWKSRINANTTEPGADGTFDRWWGPVTATLVTPQPWTQPMPGTARAPYRLDERCTADGKTWKSIHHQNVWPPTGAGAWGWVEVAAK